MNKKGSKKPEEKANYSELNINQKQATNYVTKSILIIVVALLFTFVSLFILFNFLYPTNNNTTNNTHALSSSTTYYKNGSSFYTLSSSQSHYKCTNSEHSGSNDYTSSSVSGTCYSWKQCDECGDDWSTCSCEDYYTCSGCGGSGTKTTTKTVTCTKCNGTGSITTYPGHSLQSGTTSQRCKYCGATYDPDDADTFFAEACPSRSPQTSTCPTTEEQTTTTKCSVCGGSGEQSSYSSYTTRNVRHSLSYSYTKYTYKNIDTGSTTTSTSSYSTATGYTVSYNSNGGSGTMSSQYFLHGHSQALTANAFTRTNYKFKGWATSSSGSVTYTDKQSLNRSSGSNITLYANWELLSFTVTLDNQEATTAGTTSVTATNGQPMPSITVPTKTGYTFGGYYSGTNGGGTQYYTASGVSARTCDLTSATTLYAKWTGYTYYVKYNSNGGSGTMGNSTHVYGTSKALSKNVFTRTGYTFAGWATSSSGAKAYSDGQSVSTLTTANGGTVNLYAVWTANKYKISFDTQNATAAGTTSAGVTYKSALPSITVATRTNYILDGYYTELCGKGVKYYDANGAALISTWTNTESITLYANWLWCTIAEVSGTATDYTVYTTSDDGKKYASLIFTPASGTVVEFSFDNSNWFTVNKTQSDVKNSTVSVGLIYYTNETTNKLVLEFKNITFDGTIKIYIRVG